MDALGIGSFDTDSHAEPTAVDTALTFGTISAGHLMDHNAPAAVSGGLTFLVP